MQNMNHSTPIREIGVLKLLVGLLVIGNGFQIAKADIWRGTAPFCDGECLSGEQEVARSDCGDGACSILRCLYPQNSLPVFLPNSLK